MMMPGGRIQHDASSKHLKVYGYSQGEEERAEQVGDEDLQHMDAQIMPSQWSFCEQGDPWDVVDARPTCHQISRLRDYLE